MREDKQFIIDGWRVYDLPVEYSEADYEEARAEITNQVRNTPGLVALFEYGCIPYPGISDMDFWAVFSDDAEKMYLPAQSALSEKTKYLMSHQITLFTEKHYRRMLYFDPWTTYAWPDGQRLLYKKDGVERNLNFENIKFTKDEKDILSLALVEEYLALVNSTAPLYANKELPVRHILETIKTCVYIIEEINLITDRKISPAFSEEFKNLGTNWFQLDEWQAVRKLIKLFHDGLLVSFEAAFSLSDWVSRYSQSEYIHNLEIKKTNVFSGSYLDKKSRNIYFNSFGDWRVFTDFVKTPSQALELSINSCKKVKINLGRYSRSVDFYVIFQPLEMSAFFMGIISEKGLLSDNLRKNVFSNLAKASVLRSKVFQEKVGMLNEITEIYNNKRVAGAGGKGWHFGNSSFQNSFEHKKLKKKLLVFWLKRKFWSAINMAREFKDS
ncbi:MAG: hypothetical protein Q8P06_01000 [Candidatus Azambacteria bacterium]|nr:hypothetical protein [Candidatus Azambacteria bacterium]